MEQLQLIEYVLCTYRECTKPLRPDDAIWDDLYDKPYCSKQHRRLDRQVKAAESRDFEDKVLRGAAS
jgi:hypothetical protein